MANTRLAFRQDVGGALGRRYYQTGTITATSTVNEIVDAKRTENRDEWDGASVYFTGLAAPAEAVVRGGGADAGRMFLDSDLGAVPSIGAGYELLKGFTFTDLNAAIDYGHRNAYSALYDALDDDTTVTETVGTIKYPLDVTWRRIAQVRRQISGSIPTRWEELIPGYHYTLRRSAAQLVYEANYDPKTTGLRLHFTGEKVPSLGSADNATSELPLEVVRPAALAWLYSKGANPDEGQMDDRFQKEAEIQMQLAEKAKQDFRMPRQPTKARTVHLSVLNDGTTVPGGR